MISGLPTSTSNPSRRMISIRIASCSPPRPDTRNVSGESVSSTRMPGLSLRSFRSRSRSWGEVTNRPSRPANGETLDENSIDTVGSSMRISGNATGFSRSPTVSPMSIVSIPAMATISPACASWISMRLSPS